METAPSTRCLEVGRRTSRSQTGTARRAVAQGGVLRAPVAQLDRALAYEARGRVFESPRAYHSFQWITEDHSNWESTTSYHFTPRVVFE